MEYSSGDKVMLLKHPSDLERIGTIITLKERYLPHEFQERGKAWLIEEDDGFFYSEDEFKSAEPEDEIEMRAHYWRHRL